MISNLVAQVCDKSISKYVILIGLLTKQIHDNPGILYRHTIYTLSNSYQYNFFPHSLSLEQPTSADSSPQP